MNIKNSIAFLFFFCCCLNFIWAQEKSNDFNFVNIEDGTSKIAVPVIIQDYDGFIWIGTNGAGLHRYDGIEYKSYKHKLKDTTSLRSSSIYCSFIDKKNRLWVGTENGLDLYDRELDQFKRIDIVSQLKNFYQSDIAVNSIIDDGTGDIFIGTYERGLLKLNSETYIIEEVTNVDTEDKQSSIDIHDLKINSEGRIYAATNYGLKVYDPKTNTLGLAVFTTEKGMQSVRTPIISLLIDNNNNLWLGSISNGIYKIDKEAHNTFSIQNLQFTNKRIFSMISNADGSILCGTENDGLFHIKANGELIKNYLFDKNNKNSIRSNSIWSLFMDNNERIWVGYYNKGIAVYDKLYDKFKNIESLASNPNSLEAGSVTGIVQDKSGLLWISTDGGGIDIYDPNSQKFIHINKKNDEDFSNLTAYDIQTIFIDSKENIWAGSWNGGVFLLKKGTKRFINYTMENTNGALASNSILSFAEDAEGIIWIGSFFSGIMSYDPSKEKFTHHKSEEFSKYGIPTSDVRKVLVDADNNLWIGTANGLYIVRKKNTDQFSVILLREKMNSEYQNESDTNHILTIYEGADKSIWIGTRGAGLCRYNPDTYSFIWYNELYELEDENVSAIIEDEYHNIWTSGNAGIHKLDLENKRSINYNINDGLLSNDFNFNAAFRDKKGNIYFGNYNGVDYFNPKNIQTNNSSTSLYLTDFKIFNKKVYPNQEGSPLNKVISETDSISLSNEQSVFTIEYTGVNYTRPEKNQYAYYLEGLEDSWNYVGNTRSATYTNLDPGNYTFKLKVANNDGKWNETPLHLQIKVLPPWWKTNWALSSYVLLFLLGIYLLNRVTKNRIREKQLIRYEREKRIKEEELHNKKLQFFTNISHEFRTPLTLIINPLEDILKNEELNLPKEVNEKHLIIHKNTDRLYRLINELMDYRKLELNKLSIKARQLDIITFVQDVVSHFVVEASHKKIDLTINHEMPELKVWVDIGMLEKIIFNLLSNAFKVTSEGGQITVSIKKVRQTLTEKTGDGILSDSFEISVSDTGPGLKKEQLDKIFERFYQVDNLNKWYYGGTGIGLEVVRSFVELHKGKVEVDSVVNEGTTFSVILPLGKKHFSESEIVLSDEDSDVLLKTKFIGNVHNQSLENQIEEEQKTNRLLIVEDNTELRNYLKTELSNTYKVFDAKHGNEGLEIAKKEVPDIIITDVIMPEMDGFEFCSMIKKDIKTSHIPILMLTAKTMEDDRLKGIESGADVYLNKPFDMRVLKSYLTQMLTIRQIVFNKYFSDVSDADINQNNTSLDKEFIQKVLNHIYENLSDPDLSVESLSSELHLSRSQFYRKIKTLTGQTANQFLRNIRLQKAKQILESGSTNISEVCYKVGFSSPSYFTKCFKTQFGILPTEVTINES
ncbi:hybrid sensor histidine kinase/response regulator transcription factor [uncultured Aquimarina sp.]|uniref:hybrid sensor histidine kinase/response regulator transcription factor n=1 Tax=uncultured Aquimarina sp. TaxID=575652 RepID=UPI00262EC830|nr:hybrid sensor histidine kinase/response regulator transcription factor [uncultured Aquimarina sp.]